MGRRCHEWCQIKSKANVLLLLITFLPSYKCLRLFTLNKCMYYMWVLVSLSVFLWWSIACWQSRDS